MFCRHLGQVVDAAYKLHTGLGPGLLESVYELVLARELERRGFRVERQKPVSFEFSLDQQFYPKRIFEMQPVK